MSLQILIFHFKLRYNAFCDYAGYIISSDIEQKKKKSLNIELQTVRHIFTQTTS